MSLWDSSSRSDCINAHADLLVYARDAGNTCLMEGGGIVGADPNSEPTECSSDLEGTRKVRSGNSSPIWTHEMKPRLNEQDLDRTWWLSRLVEVLSFTPLL